MQYVSVADLTKRWVYSRQGIHKLAARPEFPPHSFTISGGKVRVWELSAIEEYERDRPELRDEGSKQQKIKGYYLALQKGAEGLKQREALPDGNSPKK